MNTIQLIQAILQGLFEWWPISSSGVIVLVSLAFNIPVKESYITGLSLHLASGLAVLVLYRREAHRIIHSILTRRINSYVKGYILALILSFMIGYILYNLYLNITTFHGSIALILLSLGLMITTIMLLRSREGVKKEISIIDWAITGLLQGLAVLPGFSRSGLTIGYLLIRRYSPREAVKASLLLAIPTLLLAGLYNVFRGEYELYTLLVLQLIVFLISILSAKALIELSRRLKIHVFTLILAFLALIGAIVQLFS